MTTPDNRAPIICQHYSFAAIGHHLSPFLNFPVLPSRGVRYAVGYLYLNKQGTRNKEKGEDVLNNFLLQVS
jgi:hypothetical protein